MVPHKYKVDPSLGYWVNNQRIAHRDKKMTEERKRLLNSIGFAWKICLSWITLAYLWGYYTGIE